MSALPSIKVTFAAFHRCFILLLIPVFCLIWGCNKKEKSNETENTVADVKKEPKTEVHISDSARLKADSIYAADTLAAKGNTGQILTPLPDSVTASQSESAKAEVASHGQPDSLARQADYEARLLAGLRPYINKPDDKNAARFTAIWRAHANKSNTIWARFEQRHLGRLRKWAVKKFPEVQNNTAILFYPFSGPDFVHAATLFPKATTIYMLGLEPVGMIPNIAKADTSRMKSLYGTVYNSLYDILNLSFFITKEMLQDFRSTDLHGNVTAITIFMVRTGHTINSIRYIQPDSLGNFITVPGKNDKMGSSRGVEIKFTASDSTAKTLYYFSADVADRHLKFNKPFLKVLGNLPNGVTTYLKSASYLLHYGTFIKMRNLILAKSKYVLQDDTGIPLKYYKKDKLGQWEGHFYGGYTKPIALFHYNKQDDLAAVYADTLHKPEPLPFMIGYDRNKESNLQLYVRQGPFKNTQPESKKEGN